MNPAAIETEGLRVRVGATLALDDLNVSVPPGTFTAVIGPNGAGKSTLLRALLGLLTPEAGRIRLFGEPLAHAPAEWLGYVPQFKTHDLTFPARAVDLVVSGLRRSWPWRASRGERAKAEAALARAGAGHLADRLLPGLSGGELQRVHLARALVRQPRLVLLDEPNAGMDASAEADMYHVLEAYPAQTGATVVMVTHDWEGARYHASHVLLLHRQLIAFGPPADVLEERRLSQAFGHALPGHAALPPGGHPNA